MSAPTTVADDKLAYEPVRKWYRRPDVLVPVVLMILGFSLLIVVDPGQQFYSAEFTADREQTFDTAWTMHLVPQMLTALYILTRATVLGFLIAVSFGLVLALLRRSRLRVVSWPTAFVIEFIRSTPILVQFFFFQALVRATPGLTLSGVEVLVIVLGIHYATYCSEAYRAGINSVPPGQWEAATSLNLSGYATWTRIIIPQALPAALPALGNYLIAAFKDAPIGGPVLGVTCLLFFANTLRSTAFRPVEPYLLIGVGFLLVSIPAAYLVRRLERRIGYERI